MISDILCEWVRDIKCGFLLDYIKSILCEKVILTFCKVDKNV